jgi:hypothetical protein
MKSFTNRTSKPYFDNGRISWITLNGKLYKKLISRRCVVNERSFFTTYDIRLICFKYLVGEGLGDLKIKVFSSFMKNFIYE